MKKGYLIFAAILLISGGISYFCFSYVLPSLHFNVKTETWKLFGWATLLAAVVTAVAVIFAGVIDLRRRNIEKQRLLTSSRA